MELGGYAWEKAGKIWYIALTEKLSERSDFLNLANKTTEVAANIYGKGSKEQKAVLKSWKLVGINTKSAK
ncbi:hypothetical protein BH18THE1_BH18THE1_04580 [soil metagenome]